MSNGHSTIHDFDFNLICEYFLDSDRQGPGSREATLRALSFIDGLSAGSQIADLGCGTGGQTMTLARATTGHITALDLFPKFIDRLNLRALNHGVHDRVSGLVGSMDDLPFDDGSLDLIWCEGAIYHIGFERGLGYWRRFLKPGGWVAVTENTWLTDRRPAEIESFWNAAYPEIGTIAEKVAAVQRAGYEFVAAFALPETLWAEFYAHQSEMQRDFMAKRPGDPAAEALMESERAEKALWEKYKAHYGLVFYIMRAPRR
jgi:ubiquinone/menaquinone biosynthesis C-methylase UbiE